MPASTQNPDEALDQQNRCKSLHSMYQCVDNEGHSGRHEYIDNKNGVYVSWTDEEEDGRIDLEGEA